MPRVFATRDKVFIHWPGTAGGVPWTTVTHIGQFFGDELKGYTPRLPDGAVELNAADREARAQ